MKFSIDSQLKRYASALEHIARLPERQDECLAFVETHQLYSQALGLFERGGERYRRVAIAYGQRLASQGRHKEAGIMHVKGRNYEDALEAFRQAVCWQDAIVVAVKMNLE